MQTEKNKTILPGSTKPTHYDLRLFNVDFTEYFKYQGTVAITLNVQITTQNVVLNSSSITISSAKITQKHGETLNTFQAHEISHNTNEQTVNIKFTQEIVPCDETILTVEFDGTIRNDMSGFYRSRYTENQTSSTTTAAQSQDYQYMFSTQFEPCYARTAFPCFDEPNLKATFDLSLEIPDEAIALGNMPEKTTTPAVHHPGYKVVAFERTPRMSTYLLTWAIGNFEYIELLTKHGSKGHEIPLRAYTTKGLAKFASFALDHVGPYLEYYSELFGIEYPLPKMDLLVVHEFSRGAMEGWGLITFSANALLYDEKTSEPLHQTKIAYTVAHEISHQWFGNLVTMDWWTDLWLNEGFATWIGRMAVEEMHPDWEIWSLFSCDGFQLALHLDALPSSHPVEVEVGNAMDVDQVFDAISYIKGAWILKMLSGYIGYDRMMEGVRLYLNAHAYGNATTKDLWTSISTAHGKDISWLMRAWTQEVGYPLITISREDCTLSLKQTRYLSSGRSTQTPIGSWWIPALFVGHPGCFEAQEITTVIPRPNLPFIKLNANNLGFFRVLYSPELFDLLGGHLQEMGATDRISLIADTAALAFSGHSNTPTLLSFLEKFQDERNCFVWRQIYDSIGRVESIFGEDEVIRKALRVFVKGLVDTNIDIGIWGESSMNNHLSMERNSLIALLAGTHGHERVISEAKKHFDIFLNEPEAFTLPHLRLAILSIAVREGGSENYQALKRKWRLSSSTIERSIILRALCSIQTLDLLSDLFTFILDHVPAQDILLAATYLSGNIKLRKHFWRLVTQNFSAFNNALKNNTVLIERCLRVILESFADREMVRSIEEFFEGRDTQGYDRMLRNAKDVIVARDRYRNRDLGFLRGWAHAYADAS